jgi:diguanylate cyclase (GGDEF)-like protein
VSEILANAARANVPYAIEYRSRRLDGSFAIVNEFGTFGERSDDAGFATLVDVTILRGREEQNWRAAHYDELTGLPNRSLMVQRMRIALSDAQASHELAAVFVAKIDNFRELNDTYGHELGNRLLQMLALRFGECVRGGDTVARLGGDWFGVLLAGVDTGLSISDIATRLSAAISRPFKIENRPFHLTLSIGISVAPYDGGDPDVLLRAAETAMRVAKNTGGNAFRYYDSAMSIEALQKVHRQNELRVAIERNEFELHFQPLVDILADRIVAVESLVRWNHPVRGMLAPAEFIDLADQTGLIVPLGEWILRQACRQARAWFIEGLELRVCVNVSAVQFRQPGFLALVAACLEEFGFPPHLLELELTESVMLDGFAEMIQTLSRLKALGVRLAIDDFGTGYSSLAYLKYFPVDTLKIDRAFVKEITGDSFDRAIATTILTLARELNLECVVEGVETEEQCDLLRQLGCTIVQGYLFSRPVAPDRLRALLGRPLSALRA